MTASFDLETLDTYADVIVRVGLNLQTKQDLVITTDIEALPLVRRVSRAAYRAGAGLVTTFFADEDLTLGRFEEAQDHSFDRATDWLFDGMARALDDGAARLAIKGEDPGLLSAQDPDLVARASKAMSLAYRPFLERVAGMEVNWCVAAWPGAAWARRVFPNLTGPEAVAALGEAIFVASRLRTADPVAEWQSHNSALAARTKWLNGNAFSSLHFSGPGTDLTVGLADGHAWVGGAARSKTGIRFNPNIPTEEVFTTPHASRVEGHVRATKPLAHQGTVIEGISVRFEDGRIVEAGADTGQDVFRNLLATDEGAARLGEVALVPERSPIAESGTLFFNTLFDENAASHIALGQCYKGCFADKSLTPEAVTERGGNSSIIHVDWMIGSREIVVDGIAVDGTRTPVMRGGNWAD